VAYSLLPVVLVVAISLRPGSPELRLPFGAVCPERNTGVALVLAAVKRHA
jgi:hypothetical protein